MGEERSVSSVQEGGGLQLPLDIWKRISEEYFGIKEWVATCGTVCHDFNRLQPRTIHMTMKSDDTSHSALQWLVKHWDLAHFMAIHVCEKVSVSLNQAIRPHGGGSVIVLHIVP